MSSYVQESKGFFATLFDFNFTSFITLKFLKVIYFIMMGFLFLSALFIFVGALTQGAASAVFGLIFVPLGTLLGLIFLRIYFETLALFFRIGENTQAIRGLLGQSGGPMGQSGRPQPGPGPGNPGGYGPPPGPPAGFGQQPQGQPQPPQGYPPQGPPPQGYPPQGQPPQPQGQPQPPQQGGAPGGFGNTGGSGGFQPPSF